MSFSFHNALNVKIREPQCKIFLFTAIIVFGKRARNLMYYAIHGHCDMQQLSKLEIFSFKWRREIGTPGCDYRVFGQRINISIVRSFRWLLGYSGETARVYKLRVLHLLVFEIIWMAQFMADQRTKLKILTEFRCEFSHQFLLKGAFLSTDIRH